MPRGTTRRIPNHQQRALLHDRDSRSLIEAESRLTVNEAVRYSQLLIKAGSPTNTTDRAAILERAVAHVANAELTDRESGKTAEEHRKELFG